MNIQLQPAGRFHIFLARIFGKRLDVGEGSKVYYWRGRVYLVKLPDEKKANLRLL